MNKRQKSTLRLAVAVIAFGGARANIQAQQWPSPDRRLSVIVEPAAKTPASSDNMIGIVQSQLVLRGPDRTPRHLLDFDRSVDVYWSPDSRHIAITDWIGSNIADCLALDSDNTSLQISIATLLPKTPDFGDTHVYVQCHGWSSADALNVIVSGHTDSTPVHDFDYRFRYRPTTNHLDSTN